VPLVRRQRAPARKKRRWPRALAAIAALLALWILWPAAPLPEAPAVKVAGLPPPRPEPPARKVVAKPQPRPKAPTLSPLVRARRDLLLAAVRARSASLRPCVDVAELHVPVRLHVLKSGEVKSVEFAGEPPRRELRDCVRRAAAAWNFQGVELPSDVELFVTLALTPRA
jgi:hypothetical protein